MVGSYDELADSYGRHRRCNPDVVAALVEGARLTGASRVVEVGAGTGNYSSALHEATQCQCTAVEPSDGMRRLITETADAVQAMAGTAEQLPVPTGVFDLVFCVDVAHHLVDPAAFFSEAFRVLKPAGDICVVTDSEEMIRRRFPLAEYFPETVDADLARYPTIARLRELAEGAGFRAWRQTEVTTRRQLVSADAYEAKAFSVLHLISPAGFDVGIARLRADLKRGPLVAIGQYALVWASR
jgi:ubiquinone/menaquinone biosynthesis C-methylase UbiE